MRKLLVLLAGMAATAALVVPAAASAHPLGNFTINRFSRLETSGPRLYVLYVLDMAEIPTFQAGKIDAQARLWFRRALHLNPHFSLLWAPIARRYAS